MCPLFVLFSNPLTPIRVTAFVAVFLEVVECSSSLLLHRKWTLLSSWLYWVLSPSYYLLTSLLFSQSLHPSLVFLIAPGELVLFPYTTHVTLLSFSFGAVCSQNIVCNIELEMQNSGVSPWI